jgi:hypothetical protein
MGAAIEAANQVESNVRPDSELTLNAAREVVLAPEFEDMLQNVRDRVDEIEGLHRTRELTVSRQRDRKCRNADSH